MCCVTGWCVSVPVPVCLSVPVCEEEELVRLLPAILAPAPFALLASVIIRFSRGCSHRCSSRRIACTRSLRGCDRRCPSHRIACTSFRGCARRCPSHLIACTSFRGCARTCAPRRIACTCFVCGCARRCPTRRIRTRSGHVGLIE